MVSDFELDVKFVLFCTFPKGTKCFIKSEDSLGEVSPFMLDYRKCNFKSYGSTLREFQCRINTFRSTELLQSNTILCGRYPGSNAEESRQGHR